MIPLVLLGEAAWACQRDGGSSSVRLPRDGDVAAPTNSRIVWLAFERDGAADLDGGYDVETIVRRDSSCGPDDGPLISHVIRLEGLADDVTPIDDLVVHLAPKGVGRDVWNNGSTVFVNHSLCGGDPTLATDRHRRYDLEVYDGAWNGGLVRAVSTRGSFGCSTTNGSGGWLAGASLLGGRMLARGRGRGHRRAGLAAGG